MAHKQLVFRAAAREKVLQGATALADAARVTLGPKSKCVQDLLVPGKDLVTSLAFLGWTAGSTQPPRRAGKSP